MSASLFIAPHNDDEVLFGSLFVMRFNPLVAVVYDSYIQVDRGYSFCHKNARREETCAGLQELGCAHPPLFLGLDDRTVNPIEIHDVLRDLIAKAVKDDKPIAYPMWHEGGNRHHNEIARIIRDTLNIPGKLAYEYSTYAGGKRSTDGDKWRMAAYELCCKQRAMMSHRSQLLCPETQAHFLNPDLSEYYDRQEEP